MENPVAPFEDPAGRSEARGRELGGPVAGLGGEAWMELFGPGPLLEVLENARGEVSGQAEAPGHEGPILPQCPGDPGRRPEGARPPT